MNNREYNVVFIKMKKNMGMVKLKAHDYTKILNQEAAKGWTFDKALEGESFFSSSDGFFLVFYREVAG